MREHIASRKNFLDWSKQIKLSEHELKLFWKKIVKGAPGECWKWTASKQKGYGKCWIKHTEQRAHRVSWMIHNGPIPDGLHVLHNCPKGDNPECCNPEHLWLGTHRDNCHDMKIKGRSGPHCNPERMARGTAHHHSKLDDSSVVKIRKLSSHGLNYNEIGRMFGVSGNCILHVVRFKTWRHVKEQ